MKLLHFIGSIDPETGGTYEGLVRTAEMMQQLGIEVAVASLDPPGLFDADVAELPFSCYQIGADVRSYYGRSKRTDTWLAANVKEYDAVIVHGLWQYHSFAVSRACRRLSVPYFVFSHGMLDPWFNQTYPLKRLKKQVYWLWRESAVVKHACSMLFTTEEEKRLARQSFRPYACTESVVGYGTSGPSQPREALLNVFRALPPEWGKRPYWLFMSRIQEKKGVDLLLQAYAQLRQCNPELPELVIAGTAHAPEYLKLLQSRFPQDGVHWIGHVSGSLKWQALAAAEAMVLVSHQENFGIIVAEALSVGTPVLISDKVNIWREVLAENAGLVESDSVDGARRLLDSWLKMSPESKSAYTLACQKAFTAHFDINRSTQNIIDCIQTKRKHCE